MTAQGQHEQRTREEIDLVAFRRAPDEWHRMKEQQFGELMRLPWKLRGHH